MIPERLLRAFLLLLVGGLLLGPFLAEGEPPPRALLELRRPLSAVELRRIALGSPTTVVRRSREPPTAAELERLAAAAARAPLFAVLPSTGPRLEADPPAGAQAGRTAALPVRLHGQPGDSVTLTLRDASGSLDSLAVALDSAGRGAAAFRVRPARRGWGEWEIEWGRLRRRVGAWVAEGRAPRVAVHSGFPGWEGKFVVRALEESGAEVSARYELGRGLAVPAPVAASGALEGTDVVIVLDGAPLGAADATRLARWSERGGGVLLAGDRAASPGFGVAGEPGAEEPVSAAALRWRLPPELAALPPAELRASAALPGRPGPASAVLATAPSGPLLLARPLGAGRVAALGLRDTWRWRMEAGQVDAHRVFWRSLTDYLARVDGAPFRIVARPALPSVGQQVEISVWSRGGDPPVDAVLHAPGGAVRHLPLRSAGPGFATARYRAAGPGEYRVAVGGRVQGGFRADTTGGGGGWAALALLAAASGGRAVPADSAVALARSLRPGDGAVGTATRLLVFLVALAAAGGAWTLRRLRGDP